jgi:hypothetical protein
MPQVFEEELAKELCDVIRQHVALAVKPLRARIDELERCIKQIEERPILTEYLSDEARRSRGH